MASTEPQRRRLSRRACTEPLHSMASREQLHRGRQAAWLTAAGPMAWVGLRKRSPGVDGNGPTGVARASELERTTGVSFGNGPTGVYGTGTTYGISGTGPTGVSGTGLTGVSGTGTTYGVSGIVVGATTDWRLNGGNGISPSGGNGDSSSSTARGSGDGGIFYGGSGSGSGGNGVYAVGGQGANGVDATGGEGGEYGGNVGKFHGGHRIQRWRWGNFSGGQRRRVGRWGGDGDERMAGQIQGTRRPMPGTSAATSMSPAQPRTAARPGSKSTTLYDPAVTSTSTTLPSNPRR